MEKEPTETKLRRQIAEGEAKLDALRSKLAKILAKKSGEKAPATGLDMLWEAALRMSRTRSSKQQCRTEWNRIPIGERPTISDLVAALKIWNRTDEWKKDGNAFAPGLHKFIKERRWEWLPDDAAPPKPRVEAPKAPVQTDEDRAELLRFLTTKSSDLTKSSNAIDP